MLETLKRILGIKPPMDYKTLVKEGAIILDVRTPQEFKGGHINGAVNISVDSLPNQLGKFKDKNRTIITCCASGMRSGRAKGFLKSKGYENVHNGGPWNSLNYKLK